MIVICWLYVYHVSDMHSIAVIILGYRIPSIIRYFIK